MGRNLTNLFISESYEFLTQISGSELQDGLGNDITFLAITASQANNATSASFASTSVSSSFAQNANSASHALNSDNATSASFAQTASFALNVPTIDSGSFLITASSTNDTITYTKGDGSTFTNTINNVVQASSASFASFSVSSSYSLTAESASYAAAALSSSHAINADSAISSSYATNSDTAVSASFATNSTSASFAQTASFALNVPTVDTGSFLTTASISNATITFTKGDASTFNVTVNNVANANLANVATAAVSANTAISASQADNANTASFASNIADNLNITASNILVNNNLAVVGTASFSFVQTVTGSAVIINEEFIILNAQTPAAPYAGIIVFDSGSNQTASLEWDGNDDNWIIQEETGNTAVILTGPTGSRGSEIIPTVNRLQKGIGHHSLGDSNISDNGSVVSISTPLEVTGSINATSFTGSLDGNASTATSASHAQNADNAISSSFASTSTSASFATNSTSASFADNATSASFATNSTSASFASTSISSSFATSASFAQTASFALNATPAFPFTGSAGILGDLTVNGEINRLSGSFSGSAIDNITDTFATPKVEHVVTLTQTEYNALTPDPDTLYIISGSIPIDISGFATTGSNIFNGNQIVTGSVSATLGFTGSLQGTSSFATSASHALNADEAISASFATTASYALNADISGFPFTGSAEILGSLNVDMTESRVGTVVSGSFTGSFVTNIVPSASITQAQIEKIVTLDAETYASLSGSNEVFDNTLYIISDSTGSIIGSTTITGSLRGNVGALSISSNTASLDCSTGNFFTLLLVAGSDTFVEPTNIEPGQTINLRVKQASTPTGTISFDTSVKQVSGSAYVASDTANAEDIVTFISFDSTNLYLSNIKNFV